MTARDHLENREGLYPQAQPQPIVVENTDRLLLKDMCVCRLFAESVQRFQILLVSLSDNEGETRLRYEIYQQSSYLPVLESFRAKTPYYFVSKSEVLDRLHRLRGLGIGKNLGFPGTMEFYGAS